MLDRENLVALGKALANADKKAPIAYSFEGKNYNYEALNETFRQELNEMVGTPKLFNQNKYEMFELLEEVIDDVLPKTVSINYQNLAEFKTFAQGDKPIFRRHFNSKTRAKQFITRVGLAGRYEVFKLASSQESFEIRTSAIGGAAEIGYEEFLDGRVDFSELIAIITEGMDELIYKEIAKAMVAGLSQLPAINKVATSDFDEKAMDNLLMRAEAFGTPTIYCTSEFAVKMVPQEAWRYTESMKDELYRTGRLAGYKGRNVVVLDQGFDDIDLASKVLDPGYAWIIPAGANTKPIKVAFEGGLQMRDIESQDDWSHRVEFYQKVGVVPMFTNDIFCYVDESLAGQMDASVWNLYDTVKNVVEVSNMPEASKDAPSEGQGEEHVGQ